VLDRRDDVVGVPATGSDEKQSFSSSTSGAVLIKMTTVMVETEKTAVDMMTAKRKGVIEKSRFLRLRCQ
jgi:hypothetical protein